MRYKVTAEDSMSFTELIFRLTDTWEEEPLMVSEEERSSTLLNPPSALLFELEEMGYAVEAIERERAGI